MADENDINPNDIAIVGMAVRVPGAGDTDAYWRNLRDGVESIRTYTDEELIANGEQPELLRRKNYVRAAAPLDGMELFDGEFFGFSPKESAILDPQHRHFYELCWEAFERAGHPPERFAGPIGLWAGCGMGSYFYFNLCRSPELVRSVGMFLLRHTGNDKDFLATRVSYLFDLKGPAIGVQTACSTSLVAVHLACQSLLAREVDMALAGGVTIELPHRRGYLFHEGEILSPDGHCHAFDHRAQGTVFGSGAGVVVLRRLEDALADGDVIHAVIRGTAVNNDGSGKVNYLAPSVDGQARCMAEAHALADVPPDTIGYVEAHGTGTYLGDPIEIAALTQAFRRSTQRVGFCRIGSVKTNIGHLDTAAGVASLVKAALALRERQMPPTLGFERPNPTIGIETTPFVINDRLRDWPRGATPRRAAVNSLGVGGTNAHVILEEAPARPASPPSARRWQLLTISGRNAAALQANATRLAEHLRAHPEQPLADVAWTLHHGRRAFEKRRVVACASHEEGARLLADGDPRRVFGHTAVDRAEAAFLFPGGGAQYARMGADLYESEPVYRREIDRGLELLRSKHDIDLRPLLFAPPSELEAAGAALEPMPHQLPAIFLVEHALARLWASWGVQPTALLGHSLGENTAACVAGVMSFEDALGLVTLRGKLFARVPGGGMLSVNLPEAEVRALLESLPELEVAELDVAVINVPDVTVVSGPTSALEALSSALTEREVEHKRLAIPVAAHSRALAPILEEFRAYLRSIRLSPPKIRMLSNRSGTWLRDDEATSPDHWVEHLRGTVRFSEDLETLLADGHRVLVEVGPGRTLSSLARQHPRGGAGVASLVSLRHRDEDVPDDAFFLTALGRAWATGLAIDWDRMWEGETRRRVELPTYAFQRQRFFIEPARETAPELSTTELSRCPDLRDWGWRSAWQPTLTPRPARDAGASTWLVLADTAGVGARLAERLERRGHTVVTVYEGDAFAQRDDRAYTLAPERGREGYTALLRELASRGLSPSHVAHLWLLTADESYRPGSSFFHRNQERGFYSLLFLAQAFAEEALPSPPRIVVVANGMESVELEQSVAPAPAEGLAYPEKATVLGPVGVLPRELPGASVTAVDVTLPAARGALFGGRLGMALVDPFAGRRSVEKELEALVGRLEAELLAAAPSGSSVVALRDAGRFERSLEPHVLEPATDSRAALASIGERAVVLVTGGLGGLGLLFAEHLARTRRARLVLVSRSELPPREAWDAHLRTFGPEDRTSQRIARVRAIEAAGGEVLVVSADVTIEMEMEEVVQKARARFGPIEVVLHTAGVVRDALLVQKTQADCEEVFTPKIHGTLVLERVLASEPLSLFVLFSSSSTLVAAAGQVDYVAANTFLDAFARSRAAAARAAGSRTRYLALAWGVWADVGMAHEAMAERTAPETWKTTGPARHPFLDAVQRHPRGQLGVLGRFHPARHWLLDEHRTAAGHALVPGTGFLELARAALREIGEQGPFALEDVFFIRPLALEDDETREVRVSLRPADSGYSLEIRSRITHDGAPAWELHAQAQVSLVALRPPAPLRVSEVEGRCRLRRQASPEGLSSPQERHLRFGPRWRVLREVLWGRGEALAELSLDPRFEGEASTFALHPALLDLATGFGMDLIEGYDASSLWVPVGYESVRVHRPLPARIRSWVKIHPGASQTGDFAHFDVVLTDLDGAVCVEIRRFSIKRLEGPVDVTQRSARPAPGELWREDGEARELSPAEEQLRRNLSQGIRPEEGVDALERALASDPGPTLVVSSLHLPSLVEQAARTALTSAPTGDGATFARPDLESEYVAPRDDLERTLVGFFQELLGVDMVGVDDSFFDLGGHSLIAVRLFAAIKKTYRAEFPISLLFEAPTVSRIAQRVREKVGMGSPEASTSQATSAGEAPRARFQHLVAMHPGGEAPVGPSGARPFFLVAGMFGNVLNLRHLAHLVGSDRPFYGLQARGLYGDERPHETFEEMARAYLAEIRAVQPRGPYLLGGFSGGGVTAYEMTRQLAAEGDEVALLVMLDTPVPHRPPLTARDRALLQLEELRAKGPAYLGEWAEKRARWELAKLRKRFEEAEPDARVAEFHNDKMEAAFRSALGRYVMRRLEGDVLLYRPRLAPRWVLPGGTMIDEDRHYMSPDNGWTPWVRGLEIVEVPGDHDAMVLEPNVRVLARRMRKAIEAAEARIPAKPTDLGPSPAARALEASGEG
jgi:acyl transferase domain-containing protein/thioesterase domain-containing protein/acyl carrier protein